MKPDEPWNDDDEKQRAMLASEQHALARDLALSYAAVLVLQSCPAMPDATGVVWFYIATPPDQSLLANAIRYLELRDVIVKCEIGPHPRIHFKKHI